MTQCRTCDQLGVCQNRIPACTGCEVERARLEAIDRTMAEAMTPLSMSEELFAWVAVAVCCAAGVSVVLFVAGLWFGGAL